MIIIVSISVVSIGLQNSFFLETVVYTVSYEILEFIILYKFNRIVID